MDHILPTSKGKVKSSVPLSFPIFTNPTINKFFDPDYRIFLDRFMRRLFQSQNLRLRRGIPYIVLNNMRNLTNLR